MLLLTTALLGSVVAFAGNEVEIPKLGETLVKKEFLCATIVSKTITNPISGKSITYEAVGVGESSVSEEDACKEADIKANQNLANQLAPPPVIEMPQ